MARIIELVRKDIEKGAVRYLTNTPQVHMHMLKSDAEGDRDGWSVVEFCCHGCHTALLILFDWPAPDAPVEDPTLRGQRDTFQEQHRACPNMGGTRLCPLERRRVGLLDLREKRDT